MVKLSASQEEVTLSEVRRIERHLRQSMEKERWNEVTSGLASIMGLGEKLAQSDITLRAQRVKQVIDNRMVSGSDAILSEVENELDWILGRLGHWNWSHGGSTSSWKVV